MIGASGPNGIPAEHAMTVDKILLQSVLKLKALAIVTPFKYDFTSGIPPPLAGGQMYQQGTDARKRTQALVQANKSAACPQGRWPKCGMRNFNLVSVKVSMTMSINLVTVPVVRPTIATIANSKTVCRLRSSSVTC